MQNKILTLNVSQRITLAALIHNAIANNEREYAAAVKTIAELSEDYAYRHEWTDTRDFIAAQIADLKAIREAIA